MYLVQSALFDVDLEFRVVRKASTADLRVISTPLRLQNTQDTRVDSSLRSAASI